MKRERKKLQPLVLSSSNFEKLNWINLFVEQDALMSPNPSGKLEDLVVVVCVCLVV